MDNILKEVEKLTNKGSQIKYLKELKEEILASNYDIVMDNIINDIIDKTNKFINNEFISGISLGINLENYKFILNMGYANYNDDKITNDTLFDIASITKLFTTLLTFKLSSLNYLTLDEKITNQNYNLEDFTIDDLLKMYGILETDKRIDKCNSYSEAISTLYNIKLISNQRKKPIYTDMNFIVLSDIISNILSDKLNQKLSYDEVMQKFLIEPLNLKNTTFFPKKFAATGNKFIYPNDLKARILGPIGSAGLFTNNDDLFKLFDSLDSYLDNYYLEKLSKRLSKENYRSYGGVNLKHPDGIIGSFAPLEYSNQVYAMQGYTGSVVINDPINKINNNFLISTMKDNFKDERFMDYYNDYQEFIIKKTLSILILNRINETKGKIKKITL